MRNIRFLPLLLAAACLASGAEQGGFSGPVSGVLFDSQTRAIRPVMGVPGAAYLGPPLAAEFELASVSPSGRMALAVERGRAVLIPLSGDLRTGALDGALENVSRIAWVDASAAVIAAGSRVQLWRNLDQRPELAVGGEVEGEILALAAANDALLAATRGGVYLVGKHSPARLLAAVEDASALAVWGRDLYVAGRERGEILVVRDFERGAGAEFFARVDDPAGLAVENGIVFAASGKKRQLAAFRVAGGGSAGEVDLDFEPVRIERLAGPLFLLNHGGANEPLYVLDAARGLAVYFIPAGAASSMEE